MWPLLKQEGLKRSNRFPCLLPERGELAGSLYGVKVGGVSKGQVGDLGGLPIPLVVLSARGTRSTLPDTLVLLLTPCFCS